MSPARPPIAGSATEPARFGLLLGLAFALAGCGGSPDASPVPGGFAICTTCHSTEAGQNRIGPTLHGVAGRPAGSLPGFAYSPAMRESGLVWTRETLDRFLADPRGTVPGNRMAFAGIADEARRRQVIDYLMGLGAAGAAEGEIGGRSATGVRTGR